MAETEEIRLIVWYNRRLIVRRGISAMLFVLLAMQLGGMAVASVCTEPCPDDARGTSCPPVCVFCTSCTHAQTAIVQRNDAPSPLIRVEQLLPQQRLSVSSQLADDILHVPLLG